MIIKLKLFGYRFIWSVKKIIPATGANSEIGKDAHILMWDFDNRPLQAVLSSLSVAQHIEGLPEIKVFQTSKGAKYQAWCYYRTTWWNAVRIIAGTPGVDPGFFRYGIFRGRFTLRTSPKHGFKPKWVKTLESHVAPTASEFDLWSWTNYETV
jgi:hypothetical protein